MVIGDLLLFMLDDSVYQNALLNAVEEKQVEMNVELHLETLRFAGWGG